MRNPVRNVPCFSRVSRVQNDLNSAQIGSMGRLIDRKNVNFSGKVSPYPYIFRVFSPCKIIEIINLTARISQPPLSALPFPAVKLWTMLTSADSAV
jgi:hypothetical protein